MPNVTYILFGVLICYACYTGTDADIQLSFSVEEDQETLWQYSLEILKNYINEDRLKDLKL